MGEGASIGPLVVIEAKRPEGAGGNHPAKAMVNEGISQHLRNQRPDEIPPLFAYAQVLLAISQIDGRYGTTHTAAKFWARWREEDAGLRAHGERFAAEVKDADDALAARAAAESKNAAFRAVGAYAAWMRGVLDTREHVWIELERRRADDKAAQAPRDRAARFFRPRVVAESEADRKARADARDKERQDREAAAERRKLLAASLKKAQADLKEHDKKTARGR